MGGDGGGKADRSCLQKFGGHRMVKNFRQTLRILNRPEENSYHHLGYWLGFSRVV